MKYRRKRAVKMTPEVRALMLEQLEAFREKFGRDPEGNDPVFFDPDEDVPVQISEEKFRRELLEGAAASGVDPSTALAMYESMK